MAMSYEKLGHQKQVNALISQEKDYSVGVKGCPRLSVRVRENGTKEYRYIYTHPSKKTKSSRTLGSHPSMNLKSAINIAKQLNEFLKKGIPPESAFKTNLIENGDEKPSTFDELAQRWVENRLSGGKEYSDSTVRYWQRNISYLNEFFGDTALQAINSRMILAACESKQLTSGKKVGIDMRSYCQSIFAFGKLRGWLDANEAIDTKGALLSMGAPKNHPAVLDELEIGRLLHGIEQLKNTRTNINTIRVLTLLPHLFVRSIDIRSMRWQDIDWQQKRWVFEPKKGQHNERMVDSLIVPLSDFVLAELKEQMLLTGTKEYVFASTGNTNNAYISRNVLNSAIERIGFAGKHSPHGFRATAKTIAMEAEGMGFSDVVTELQLGHRIKDIHGTAYNRIKMLDERTQLMQKLSDWLLSAQKKYEASIKA